MEVNEEKVWSACLPLEPAASSLIPSIPKRFLEEKTVDVTEVDQ